MHDLAIVVPCFNEEEVLPETVRRLEAVLDRLETAGKIREGRIYLVDDGSTDRTWEVIDGLVEHGLPVVGLKLSRNRGHQRALLAGLFAAEGDAVVTIDADLQDDVNAIAAMVDEFEAGAEVVYGVRRGREMDTMFKRFTARLFYRLMASMGVETVFDHADYRLLSRRAVEALKEYGEVNLYLRGIIPLIGLRSATVHYDRTARFAGESKYPLKKMVALSVDAITSFSAVPLRLIGVLGLLVAAGSAVLGLWALFAALVTKTTVTGWASTILPIYFLGGVQLLAVGVIGEYVGKIYIEMKRRPRFLVETVKDRRTRQAAAPSSVRRAGEDR